MCKLHACILPYIPSDFFRIRSIPACPPPSQRGILPKNADPEKEQRPIRRCLPGVVEIEELGLKFASAESAMSHTDTRQHPRFPLRLPVLCESPEIPDYRTVGFTYDVSRGGLLLEVLDLLSPGNPASLLLPTCEQNARAEAVVIWTAEGAPGRMGLRFTNWAIPGFPAWERLLALQAGPTPRTSVRTPVALEVTCRISPDTILPGQARNLSDGGLMIALPRPLPPQTRLTLEVPRSSTLSPVEAEMEVLWTGAARADRSVLHGLGFRSADIDKELFLVGALLRGLVATD